MESRKIREDSLPERLRTEGHGHCRHVMRTLNTRPVGIIRRFRGWPARWRENRNGGTAEGSMVGGRMCDERVSRKCALDVTSRKAKSNGRRITPAASR